MTMPQPLPGNAAGEIQITTDCIDCDMCHETAPQVFQRDADLGMSVVYRQPGSSSELAAAEEALSGCPTEAIRRFS